MNQNSELYVLALIFLYNAQQEGDYELVQQIVMIAYDPEVHTWLDPESAPEFIPDPSGATELVITNWQLATPPPTIAELDAYIATQAFFDQWIAYERELARVIVYDMTESKRGLYLTLRIGKLGEYETKKNEARTWENDGKPQPGLLSLNWDEDNYPISKLEAPQWELTQIQLLQWWLDIDIVWGQASSIIASQERYALETIKNATTVEAVRAAPEGMVWDDLPAFPPQPTA